MKTDLECRIELKKIIPSTFAEKLKTIIYSYKVGEFDEITMCEKIEHLLKDGNCSCEFKDYCFSYNVNKHCNNQCLQRMKEYLTIKTN
jgi:hypothetical protein